LAAMPLVGKSADEPVILAKAVYSINVRYMIIQTQDYCQAVVCCDELLLCQFDYLSLCDK